jgi:hypothetical protein
LTRTADFVLAAALPPLIAQKYGVFGTTAGIAAQVVGAAAIKKVRIPVALSRICSAVVCPAPVDDVDASAVAVDIDAPVTKIQAAVKFVKLSAAISAGNERDPDA